MFQPNYQNMYFSNVACGFKSGQWQDYLEVWPIRDNVKHAFPQEPEPI